MERDVILIRLANEVEDHLDLGILYCANLNKRLRYINKNGQFMIKMANELGFSNLASELEQVFQASKSNTITPELRTNHHYSFLFGPKSYQRKWTIALRQTFVYQARYWRNKFRNFG